MSVPRHEQEVDEARLVWARKPLLADVYGDFYARVRSSMDDALPGRAVEIGSGIGSLRDRIPTVLASDSFVRPWLDVTADAYTLPFRRATLSHVIAIDVLHHLARPMAFLGEARRVLVSGGRVILIEPYISLTGRVVYGLFHDEPLGLGESLDWSTEKPASGYHAAQGNATRMFFGGESERWSAEWQLVRASRFAAFAYLLSGGFSRPAFYPRSLRSTLNRGDALLSRIPRLFAARCLVVLQRI
jgi:SAM-dependent methyltransferase